MTKNTLTPLPVDPELHRQTLNLIESVNAAGAGSRLTQAEKIQLASIAVAPLTREDVTSDIAGGDYTTHDINNFVAEVNPASVHTMSDVEDSLATYGALQYREASRQPSPEGGQAVPQEASPDTAVREFDAFRASGPSTAAVSESRPAVRRGFVSIGQNEQIKKAGIKVVGLERRPVGPYAERRAAVRDHIEADEANRAAQREHYMARPDLAVRDRTKV